nr:hypothetical protein [Tanacetum cinerariifolium]
MNNLVTVTYRFELHFNATFFYGFKSGNYWWRVMVVDGADGGLKGCLVSWDQSEELIVKPLSASFASKGPLNVRLWYASYLELPDGTVLKGAMLGVEGCFEWVVGFVNFIFFIDRTYEIMMVVVGECEEGSEVYWWRRMEKMVAERRGGGGACVEGGGGMVVVYELRIVVVIRRGNTTDRGIDAAGRAGGVVTVGVRLGNTTTPVRVGYLVGIPILFENTTTAGRGSDAVGLGVVASSVGGGLMGI